MKQAIENSATASSLEHSMIDESNRKGWEYYAVHTERRLNPESAKQEANPEDSNRLVPVAD